MLVADATDCVYGGRDDTGPGNAALGLKSERLVCTAVERGVGVPTQSTSCALSSIKLVGLRLEF